MELHDEQSPRGIEENELFRLWARKRAGRRYPARRDFTMPELRPWLGEIQLVDVVRENGVRYRFRLVGTHITDIDGTDVTGRFADEAFADNLQYITTEYDEVLRTGKPCMREREVMMNRRGTKANYNKLVLPLSTDGDTIDMLLVHLRRLGRLD